MTVKQRLYISNILMIVIPVLLCIITGAIVINVAMSFWGIRDTRGFDFNSEFNRAMVQAQQLSEKWSSNEMSNTIAEDVTAFGEQYSKKSITLAVYKDGEPLCASGEIADDFPIQLIFGRTGNHRLITDDTIIYKMDSGAYTVILYGTGYLIPGVDWRNTRSPQSMFYFSILMFSVIIAIVLITNRLLTRVVYNSIVTPLDALVYGVHQLRDGNLEYRIEYTGKDEFAGVCSDFNEMAGRLLNMVNARQKDDENRRELIAGISHDLRTPLTSIKAYVEGLEKGVASTRELQKKYFDTIKSKADDLEHIVSQLFLFSKLDVGEFPFRLENLDIGAEILEFIGSVAEEYEQKGLRIVLDTIEPGLIVSADPVQLRNVFINIVENSLKYGKSQNGIIRVKCEADNQNVRISLTDNGSGVPKESLENLFTVFYRGDKARSNPGQGSGLGLAITAKILERLGGSAGAVNAPEGGLRVIINLPVVTGGTELEKNTDY